MRLARYDAGDGVRTGVVVAAEAGDGASDGVVDLAMRLPQYATMAAIIAAGPDGLAKIAATIDGVPADHALSAVRLRAPIERPGKYMAIAMNYAKHAQESERIGARSTERQMWFNKQTSCLSGPYDVIEPGVSEQLDHEVELALVIGRTAKGVQPADALDHIFGYTVANDVTARDWQRHSPTFTMGKSFDTHGPIGPWIVTADAIPDPLALVLECQVNGTVRQRGTTADMIHPIPALIAYLSTAFTLEPGDLLATGTPEGIGAAAQPPRFLRPGDVVRCTVEGIGTIENRVA